MLFGLGLGIGSTAVLGTAGGALVDWILRTGFWVDTQHWNDTQAWKDS